MANDKTTAPESAICNRMARLLEIAGWRDAADYVRSDYITGKVSDLMPPDLSDPVVVHANMLHGAIAKLTAEQIKHLYPDLAAARAEIERLTKVCDEARAQVAAAYKAAEQAKVFMAEEGGFLTRVPLLPETKAAIRALTPADAQAALAAYGRSKVQEGMQRAAEVARECWNDPPCEADAEYIPNAILADMEDLE